MNERIPRRAPIQNNTTHLINELIEQNTKIIHEKQGRTTNQVKNRHELETAIRKRIVEMSKNSSGFAVHISFLDLTKPPEEQLQHHDFVHMFSEEHLIKAKEAFLEFLDTMLPKNIQPDKMPASEGRLTGV